MVLALLIPDELAAIGATAGNDYGPWGVTGAVWVGLLLGLLIGHITEYYTSDHYKPVQFIAAQSTSGAATIIIAGTRSA